MKLTDAERAAIAAQLDIPPDTRLHVTDSGSTFGEYILVFFGIAGNTMADQPWWGYDEDNHAMQVRMIRLYRRGGRVLLERRWRPGQRPGPVQVGLLTERVEMDEVRAMCRVAYALDAFTRRGAPKGKRGPRKAEDRRWWKLAQEIGWDAAREKHKAQGGTWAEWIPIYRHRYE
jgi:hypothetical protein